MLNKENVEQVLKGIIDPEVGIDIWTMGLIYDVKVEDKKVNILLTFTTPTCPYGPQMVEDVKKKVKAIGAETVEVDITFTPKWEASDDLREMLGV